MNAKMDFWLSLTVTWSLMAMVFIPLCILSFLAVARWERGAAETERPRRIRVDLRVPAALLAFGSVTLAWCSYRRYAHHLRDQK